MRKLTNSETDMLRRVFDDTVDYTLVRIHERHPLAEIKGMGAFVVGNNIILSRKYEGDRKILIHETAHVWQFQNDRGWEYFFNALGHHVRRFFDKHNPYDYTDAQDKVAWREWNAEQQAQWIMDKERLPDERMKKHQKSEGV